MSESISAPVKLLADDLEKFTTDIESLRSTLPLVMELMKALQEQSSEEFKNFLVNNATLSEDDPTHQRYVVKIEDAAAMRKLKRQRDHSLNAYRFLPRHFIISLVSQYDSFLGRIIRFIFTVRPELLNASEKVLKYGELVRFSDMSAAREYVIEKEVEAVIRKSHTEQFEWLQEKLKTPFNKGLQSWPTFVEVTERRNLFVHCDGRVSSQYLQVCAEHKCDIPASLSVGDQVSVSADYFGRAYMCIYEIGVKLAHVVWRRICPEALSDSDTNITDTITFPLIEKGQFKLAIRLLDFFTEPHVKHADDNARRILAINKAQAYKWSGNKQKCLDILDGEDWSACAYKFGLAAAVLREDYNQAFNFMKRLKDDTSFHRVNYRDWPLFRELRKLHKFAETYEECYGERLNIVATTTISGQEDDGRSNQARSEQSMADSESPSGVSERQSNGQ